MKRFIKELFGWYDDPNPNAENVGREEPHCAAPEPVSEPVTEPITEPDLHAAEALLAQAASALFALQLHLKGVSGKGAFEKTEGTRIIFKAPGAVISADSSIDAVVIFFDEKSAPEAEIPHAGEQNTSLEVVVKDEVIVSVTARAGGGGSWCLEPSHHEEDEEALEPKWPLS